MIPKMEMRLNLLKSGWLKVRSIFSNCSKKPLNNLTKLKNNSKCVRILHATLFKRSIIRIKESIESSFLPVPTNMFKISGSESLSKYTLTKTTWVNRTKMPHNLKNTLKIINLLGFHSMPKNNKKYFKGETAMKKRSFNSFMLQTNVSLKRTAVSFLTYDDWRYYWNVHCL